jgi:hypothetical protein
MSLGADRRSVVGQLYCGIWICGWTKNLERTRQSAGTWSKTKTRRISKRNASKVQQIKERGWYMRLYVFCYFVWEMSKIQRFWNVTADRSAFETCHISSRLTLFLNLKTSKHGVGVYDPKISKIQGFWTFTNQHWLTCHMSSCLDTLVSQIRNVQAPRRREISKIQRFWNVTDQHFNDSGPATYCPALAAFPLKLENRNAAQACCYVLPLLWDHEITPRCDVI